MMAVRRAKSARRSKAPANTSATGVPEYLAKLPPEGRRHLRRMRAAIRGAAPQAVEGISYGIPVFKLDGRPLVYFAAWKSHTSLYPMTAAIKRTFAAAIEGYPVSTGTIRFPFTAPPPAALVRQLVRARIAELREKNPVKRRK